MYGAPYSDADVLVIAAALLHAARHQAGGADEINVGALSGVLADAQVPIGHHTLHENGNADEVDVAGLSGLLADDQHIIDAEAVSAMGAKADGNPLHHDKAPGIVFCDTEVYNANAPAAWTDLDLSGVVGSNNALVMLRVRNNQVLMGHNISFREDDTVDVSGARITMATADAWIGTVWLKTDASGVIEWKSSAAGRATIVNLIAYMK